MAKTLKMTFGFADGKTTSWSLPDPKNDIDGAEVETAMQEVLDKQMISLNGVHPVNIKEAIIREVTETPLL